MSETPTMARLTVEWWDGPEHTYHIQSLWAAEATEGEAAEMVRRGRAKEAELFAERES